MGTWCLLLCSSKSRWAVCGVVTSALAGGEMLGQSFPLLFSSLLMSGVSFNCAGCLRAHVLPHCLCLPRSSSGLSPINPTFAYVSTPKGLQHTHTVGFSPISRVFGKCRGCGSQDGATCCAPTCLHLKLPAFILLSSCFKSSKPSFGMVAFHLVLCLLR